MESNVLEVEKAETVIEADLYHRPANLTRVSTLANIIGWVVLVISVGIFGYFLYSLIESVSQAGGAIVFGQIVQYLITPFLILVIGLFLFAVLEWMSEVIYVWMDIEENTRK
ncbi:MAG: hypothetical protein ACYC6H_10980 [Bellilinea sp.]